MAFPNILRNIKGDDSYFKSLSYELRDEEKKSIKYIDYFLFPSNNVAKSLINEGISKKKFIKISYGVDYNKFKPKNNKNYSGDFKVSFAGNINYRKGIPILLKAWKELNLKNAQLNLYGRVYSEILPLLRDKEDYNIITRGYVNLSKELPKNHIHIHPSLLETTPKTMNEASASGLPVITTLNSGPNFTDGVEGYIVDHQNVEQIKKYILKLYDDRKLLKKLSKNARKFAEKKSWDDYGLEVYNNYLESIS